MDVQGALQAFKDARMDYVTTPGTVGTAEMDLSGAASETLQILGQIVVDRASSKAYLLLQNKVESLLECSKPTSKFPATSAPVASLRLQDLAMAPNVLFTARGRDLVRYVGTTWPGPASATLAAGAFSSVVVPLVAKPSVAQDAAVRSVVNAMSSYVANLTPSDL